MRNLFYSLFLVPVSLTLLVSCGKKAPLNPVVFPDKGITDIQSIPAGTYKATRVKSYLVGSLPQGKQTSIFDHRFAHAGDPEKEDEVDRASTWEGKTAGKVAQLSMETNLPLVIDASGRKITFKETHYYWQYQRSDDSWAWRISGDESPEGSAFFRLFEMDKRGETPVYGDELVHATAKVQGNEVSVYYEAKVEKDGKVASTQVVEVTYRKQ